MFQKEVEQWTIVEPASDAGITKILASENRASEFLLGGPNILKLYHLNLEAPSKLSHFERIYTNLPPHTYVTLVGKFWYFDSSSDFIQNNIIVEMDSWQPDRFFHKKGAEPLGKIQKKVNEILNPGIDPDSMKFGTHHVETELLLRIFIQLLERREVSFGFRELTIHFSNYSGASLADQFRCQLNSEKSSKNFVPKCRCPLDQFLDGNLTCQKCSSNCDACFGSHPLQCLSCSPGSHWIGTECSTCHLNCRTCTGPTEHECPVCNFRFYNFGNGSCQEACEWPLRPVWTGSDYQCIKACEPGEYGWSLNKTCRKNCEPPLVDFEEKGVSLCKNPCSDREFLYTNGSCFSTCPGPLLAELYPGSVRYCKNPCEGASQYLYWNRSCLESCPAPLQIRSDPGVKYCKNPCSSNMQFYLYNNGSCHPTCPWPLRAKVENGVKYCLRPCQSTGEYILKDGSCSVGCPAPLVRRSETLIGTSCLSPCESGDYFVTNNGLCLLSCPSSFETRIEYGVKFCLSPCLADQYYFDQNKSCLSTCSYPLKVRSEAGVNFCQNPCPGGSGDFIYDDQSCHKNCPAPLVNFTESEGVLNYCKSPCYEEEDRKYVSVDGSCQESCEYPYMVMKKGPYHICLIDASTSQIQQVKSMRHTTRASNVISEIGGLLGCLIDAGDATSIFMIPLLKMLETIRYTEITIPVNIELILNQREQKRILREEEDLRLIDLRENLDHHLLILGMVCFFMLLILEVKVLIKPQNGSRVSLIIEQCSFALQWNISASVLISLNGNAFLYLLVTFKNSQLDEIYGSLRTFICLAVPLLTIFIGYKILSVSSEVRSIRGRHLNEGQEQYLEASLSGLQRWKFIFEIYKSDSLPQRLFVLIYIIRVVSVNLVLGCFSQYPLVQAILMVSMSFGMLLYLIWSSPIQKTMGYIQHIAIEISLLLYNILLTILAVQENEKNLGVIGQLMTILYLITPIATAIMIVVKLLYDIYSLPKIYGSKIGPSGGIIQLGETNSPRAGETDGGFNDESVEPQNA